MFVHIAGEAIHLSPFLQLITGAYKTSFILMIIAHFYRHKREAFRGSEHAARILADNGIPVIIKVYSPSTH